MMGDAEDGTYGMYLDLSNSRAPAAQSSNQQHQYQQHQYRHSTTPGNLLDLTGFGGVHNNSNSPSAQQQYVGGFPRELAGVPPDSYGKDPFTPKNSGNPAFFFINGLVPRPPGLAPLSPHSGGASSLGLEDASSFTTGNTGFPTTAYSTSDAGLTSHPRHGFNRPSRPIRASRQPVFPESRQFTYPLEPVDNYNVPNYGAPAATTPRLNGNGQGAQFQARINARVSFAPLGNIGTDGHSDYTPIHVSHELPMTYIGPEILTAANSAESFDVSYSDDAMDIMDGSALPQPPPASNFKSHSDNATFESSGDDDLLRGVGHMFNTSSSPYLHQTAQQVTPDGRHVQANYTTTEPPFSQQWPPDHSARFQGEGIQNYTCVVPCPDSQFYHTAAGTVDTTAEANQALPLFATGSPSAGEEPYPIWQAAPMGGYPPTQHDTQAPQTGPNQAAAIDTLPSGPPPAEGGSDEAMPRERVRTKKKFSQAKKDSFNQRRNGKTVCIRCRYSHAVCEEALGQSCSYCEKRNLLCARAYFCPLYRDYSILPLSNPGDGDENSPAAMVSDDVDIALLKKRIDGLDPGFNIRVKSADGNLDAILDMGKLHKPLCQGASDSRSDSDTAPTNHGRIANPFKWALCVKGSEASQSIDVLARLYLACSPITFRYVTKADSTSVREIQDHEHNGALDEVVRLLCRNLEFETWDAFHDRIYNHKDMGRKKTKRKKSKTRKTRKPRARKPSPQRNHAPNVRTLASELLILLCALRVYFRSLTRGATKLLVGVFCKRLYCYFLFLQREKPPYYLGRDDLRGLREDLKFGVNELPSDKEPHAFLRWIGVSAEDKPWWEERMREETWLP